MCPVARNRRVAAAIDGVVVVFLLEPRHRIPLSLTVNLLETLPAARNTHRVQIGTKVHVWTPSRLIRHHPRRHCFTVPSSVHLWPLSRTWIPGACSWRPRPLSGRSSRYCCCSMGCSRRAASWQLVSAVGGPVSSLDRRPLRSYRRPVVISLAWFLARAWLGLQSGGGLGRRTRRSACLIDTPL